MKKKKYMCRQKKTLARDSSSIINIYQQKPTFARDLVESTLSLTDHDDNQC